MAKFQMVNASSSSSSSSFLCDHGYDENLLSMWRNGSNWTDVELLEYGCAYFSFKKFQRAIDYVRTVLYFTGGSVGIVSATLALLTFNSQRQEFAPTSFSYHRAINAIELPFMVLMIEHAIRDYTSPSFLHSYAWATFFTKVGGKVDNILPTSVNILTLFIAIERAIACLAPKRFPIINRPMVVWMVVFSSICISALLWAPSSFAHTIMYDNRTHPPRYMPVWTEFGKGRGYRVYDLTRHVMTLIGSVLMVLATISAVVGLQQTAARSYKRKLPTRKLSASRGSNAQNEYWSLLKNLSYLQLCETVPLIFLHAFLVATESIYWDFKGGGAMAPFDTSFPEAMGNLRLARARQHAAICLDISNVAAHSFHFYWYLIFCPKVRHGFISFVQHGWSGRRPSMVVNNSCRRGTGSGSNPENYNQSNCVQQLPLAYRPATADAAQRITANEFDSVHANGVSV